MLARPLVALKTLGRRVMMSSAWGSTETAPMATLVHFPIERAGNIGLPAPGTEIKLVPSGTKLEMRVRGPNVTPGYYTDPELTRQRFDEDGFFRSGDAGRLADPGDPSRGLMFDGRIAEDFKLMSGTWVHVGLLRLAAIAAGSPIIQDAVVAGEGREEVGLLVFPSLEGCRRFCRPGTFPDTPVSELIRLPEVRNALADGLVKHNAANPSSSTRICRVLLMVPLLDALFRLPRRQRGALQIIASVSSAPGRAHHTPAPISTTIRVTVTSLKPVNRTPSLRPANS